MHSVAIDGYHLPIIVCPDKLMIGDHLNGFTDDFESSVLSKVVAEARSRRISRIGTAYVFDDRVKSQYPDIDFFYDLKLNGQNVWEVLTAYTKHPVVNIENFISCFNGAPHVGRKLLVGCLHKFGWFEPKYCSKNFRFDVDILDGHIRDYVGDRESLYRKFFTADNDFCQNIYNINQYCATTKWHPDSIYFVERQLTESFLNIVSETASTTNYPFVTEKFLFPIITRGLFLVWGPVGYHAYVEKYFGFKKYTKLFDYRFDSIENPVERLVEMMSMIAKFSIMSMTDWRDLYEIEKDSIEFNYDWYFSKKYIEHLGRFNS